MQTHSTVVQAFILWPRWPLWQAEEPVPVREPVTVCKGPSKATLPVVCKRGPRDQDGCG